jgi:hypothetical protein
VFHPDTYASSVSGMFKTCCDLEILKLAHSPHHHLLCPEQIPDSLFLLHRNDKAPAMRISRGMDDDAAEKAAARWRSDEENHRPVVRPSMHGRQQQQQQQLAGATKPPTAPSPRFGGIPPKFADSLQALARHNNLSRQALGALPNPHLLDSPILLPIFAVRPTLIVSCLLCPPFSSYLAHDAPIRSR